MRKKKKAQKKEYTPPRGGAGKRGVEYNLENQGKAIEKERGGGGETEGYRKKNSREALPLIWKRSVQYQAGRG